MFFPSYPKALLHYLAKKNKTGAGNPLDDSLSDVFIRTGYASVIRTQDKVSKAPIKAGTINP